uniref:Ig-like domain-containing protein n=1 Tax=Lepisosteus oculatus TaxID=7918 RepID=W5MFG5_LEPOC
HSSYSFYTEEQHVSSDSHHLACLLLCNTVNYEYLYWYQQRPGGNPRYILQCYKSGSDYKTSRSEDFDSRFTGHLNLTVKFTYLSISSTQLSDSALYYCALRPTVRLITTLRSRALHSEGKNEGRETFHMKDQISQKDTPVFKTEGERATLECTFSTSSTSYWIYWYRQYPGSAPQFILYSGTTSRTSDFAKERFSSTADKNTGLTVLTISRVLLEDTSIYYC